MGRRGYGYPGPFELEEPERDIRLIPDAWRKLCMIGELPPEAAAMCAECDGLRWRFVHSPL